MADTQTPGCECAPRSMTGFADTMTRGSTQSTRRYGSHRAFPAEWLTVAHGVCLTVAGSPSLRSSAPPHSFDALTGTDETFRRGTARLLFLIVLVASGLGTASGATVDGPKLTWDVSLWGKPRAGTAVADALAAVVEERTGGAWQMTLHYGEALSKSRENLDGIAIEAFQAAMFCNFYHPRRTRADGVTMPSPCRCRLGSQQPYLAKA